MRIFRSLDAFSPTRNITATVGSYDGVHCGHRVLLRQVVDEARRSGGESLVVTFSPHPRLLLEKEPDLKLLTSPEEKCRLLEQLGIDNLLVIPFDRAFSLTPPEEFIRMLVLRARVSTLVIGYDHRFGRDKQGGHELLLRMQAEYRLRIIEVAEQEFEDEHLSSSAIRRLIERGETGHAARLLGNPYLLMAEPGPHGELRPCESRKLLPAPGEYTVRVEPPHRYAGRTAALTVRPDGTLILKTDEELPSGPLLLSFQ